MSKSGLQTLPKVRRSSYASPGGVRIYRDDSVSGDLRTDHDDAPAYDDPSKFGGG